MVPNEKAAGEGAHDAMTDRSSFDVAKLGQAGESVDRFLSATKSVLPSEVRGEVTALLYAELMKGADADALLDYLIRNRPGENAKTNAAYDALLEPMEKELKVVVEPGRGVPTFRRLRMTGSFDVVVRRRESCAVRVMATPAQCAERVLIEVLGDTLILSDKKALASRRRGDSIVSAGVGSLVAGGSITIGHNGRGATISHDGIVVRGHEAIRIEVDAPYLALIDVSGAGDLMIEDLQQPVLELDVSGAGDARVTGRVEELRLHLSGAGDVDCGGLVCERVHGRISGAGDAEVFASKLADFRISGVGEVVVFGAPEERRVQVFGLGKVRYR
ncbi:DUF2807 domain-containing protein [Rhodanobacter sp. B2A1Ga4]|uniref:GIN domain-containing protein n=1 Tax=Rhodanobacter sp. B2A1Ga4 TaxID=2778647 RepID=UPI001B397B73|nr:DUF2807 domain-containing protein [Rhodanobacter sp. B2A1Ga4]MBQ4855748.1 DUF2807 domain-containing protein [Rhodanobacter sp. B2A1Ga4]